MGEQEATSNIASNDAEIEKAFQLLEEGKTAIKFDDNNRCVTLVLGNTGSGKSTLVQWIAGHENDALVSKEIKPDSGDFIIEDDKNRVGSSINSKTTFPELVIDSKTNAAFYDLPGFSDTRSTAHDIVNNYFFKQIADHCRSVKIVLVVNYSSVREGVDRNDFVTLLRHTTSLLKNVEKFRNSFAIVVTKVENTIKKVGGKYVPIPDENIIETIADYLQKVWKELSEKSKRSDNLKEEVAFLANAVKFLDIFLHDNYARVAIFRRPDEEGPLSGIDVLHEGKERIEKMLQDLEFTPKSDDDFGYSISDASKNSVNAFVENINQNIWNELSKLIEKVQGHYCNVFEEFERLCTLENMKMHDGQKARVFETTVTDGESEVSKLLAESKKPTKIPELANAVKGSIIDSLKLMTCQENVDKIMEQSKFFDFLQTVSSRTFPEKEWSVLFERLLTSLAGEKEQIKKEIHEKLLTIRQDNEKIMQKVAKSVEGHYENSVNSTEVGEIIPQLIQGKQMIDDWIKEDDLKKLCEKMKVSKFAPDTGTFLKNAECIMNWSVSHHTDDDVTKWKLPLKKTEKYLTDMIEFMAFLMQLYYEFSEYKYQKNTSKYNVADLNDWETDNKPQGIKIDKNNFKQFIVKCKAYDAMEELKVTEFHFKLLNQVLEKTLKNHFQHDLSEPGKLVIHGDFVKFSDLVYSCGKLKLGRDITCVNIFALRTVFIDADIRVNGLQLSIIAPRWEIIEKREINIDGAPGADHVPPGARDGRNPGEDGDHGEHGRPGKPGGNFLGIGETIINGGNLTISACGGRGGAGQHGENGMKGRDGKHADIDPDKPIESSGLYLIIYNSVEKKYVVPGEPGGKGGNGGDGGNAGFGGQGGIIQMFPLVGTSNLSKKIIKGGEFGEPGTGGKGGQQGLNGNSFRTSHIQRYFLFMPVDSVWDKFVSIVDDGHNYRSHNGRDGRDGRDGRIGSHRPTRVSELPSSRYGNSSKWQRYFSFTPVNTSYDADEDWVDNNPGYAHDGISDNNQTGVLSEGVELQSISKTVRLYKKYLYNNLHDNFKRTTLLAYLSTLGDEDILKFHETSELVDEFQDLETMLQLENFDIFPLYESLLNTLRKLPRQKLSRDYSTISHLFGATLSRVITLKSCPQSYLIIDLEKYLNTAVKNISDLSDMLEKSNQLKVIIKYRDAYQSDIEFKIKEALQFIDSHLTPAIHEILQELQSQSCILLTEIKENANLLENPTSQIAPTWDGVLNCIKIFGGVVSCFGAVGIFVQSVLRSACEVAKSVKLDSKKSFNAEALRDGVLSIIEGIKNFPKENRPTEKPKGSRIICAATKVGNLVSKTLAHVKQKEEEPEQAQDALKPIEELSRKMHTEIIPALEKGSTQMNYFMDNLSGKSHVALDVAQHQVHSQLKELKFSLEHVSKGLPNEQKMSHFIDKLEETLTTLIHLYHHVQKYQEQKELAEYLASINSSGEYANRADLTKLQVIIHSSLILEQHRAAVHALTQHVFPFASHYLNNVRLVKSVFPQEGDIEQLAQEAMEEVKGLHSKFTEYKSSITNHDKIICTGHFSRDYNSAQPFFVWENSIYQDEIFKLLSGEKVVLIADVSKSPSGKDAVKFNEIGINFRSVYAEENLEIRKQLQGFSLSATHLGNSYYRYNNKFYVISSDHQNFDYTFEKNDLGEPVHKNQVYEKIKSGDFMLSPYAMWEFQICNKANEISFDGLKVFKKCVNLELIGYGSYLTNGPDMLHLDAELYYKQTDTLH